MSALNVGIVGAGKVTQVVHLPTFAGLPGMFNVQAVCYFSPTLAKAAAGACGAATYGSVEDMVESEALDVVLVAHADEFHADAAITALEAGCHVLVEKPAALNSGDIDRMIDARDKASKVVMVGYMRRFAGAYRRLRDELNGAEVKHASVRDIIGPNGYFIGQVTEVLRANDFPADADEISKQRLKNQIGEAIGPEAPADHVGAYRMLCGLGSHDLSALHGLIGGPVGVAGAAQRSGGRFVSAILNYDNFVATFEMGVDQVGDFDCFIELFTGDRRLRIDYDTPYIRNLPITFTSKSTSGDCLELTIDRPSYRDAYALQWMEFHTAVIAGGPQESTLEQAKRDQKLFAAIVAAFDA